MSDTPQQGMEPGGAPIRSAPLASRLRQWLLLRTWAVLSFLAVTFVAALVGLYLATFTVPQLYGKTLALLVLALGLHLLIQTEQVRKKAQ